MRNDYRSKLDAWVDAAERRYAGDLRVQEITRALRALSATYVERRDRGGRQHVHGALDSVGKRAAFALYYAPRHFIAVAEVVRALGANDIHGSIVDLGCGTGAAGAAWALTAGSTPPLVGIDRHPWAVAETRWTFAQFGLAGQAKQSDLDRLKALHDSNAIAAFTLNELSDTSRGRVERSLVEVVRNGGNVLILEPLARSVSPWWGTLADRLITLGGRADEWKLAVDVPPLVQRLGKAAGLDYGELRFQTIFAGNSQPPTSNSQSR